MGQDCALAEGVFDQLTKAQGIDEQGVPALRFDDERGMALRFDDERGMALLQVLCLFLVLPRRVVSQCH